MGIMQAFGQQSRDRAAVDAENAQRKQQYEGLLRQYEYNNVTANARYNLQKLNYAYKTDALNQGYARGIRDSSRRYSQQLKAGRIETQNRGIEMAQALGEARARGGSGKTQSRLEGKSLMPFQLDQAMQATNLMQKRFDYQNNVTDLRDRLKAGKNSAYAQVAMAPVAGPAPMAPLMRSYDGGGLQLAAGIGGSLLSGINTASKLTAPGQGINKWLGLS